MPAFVAPTEDYRFLLDCVLDFKGEMAALGQEIDTDLAIAVLEEAGRFCSIVLDPINRSGDEEGCRLVDGVVQTPQGFADAYRAFVGGGWPSLSASIDHGGQGLPFVLQLWLDEMISAANMSFGLFPGLTRGAIEAIAAHGDEVLKATYLPPMVSGEWTGAMALTEAHAGSDLGLLNSKAVPREDGAYAVTGAKIFISSGDHDFGGNVVHLVLARLPDAPAGVKGISLFLVPKLLPDADGEFVVPNTLSVGGLEHKMGIHAQPTCLMNYDGATGWLVGEPHRGLAAMFVMMNAERLFVGVQGLGVAMSAYQKAAAYAAERLQGRSAGARSPAPIVEHADVRRMLLGVRAFVEGGRALAGWLALQLERARAHPDPVERAKADALVALLTPAVKAAFTDMGFESAVQAQQVFGGHGYIREWGVEQLVRDARIAQIYEGTNGIQAIDLVSRKLRLDGGNVVVGYFDMIAADIRRAHAVAGSRLIAERLDKALAQLREATQRLLLADPETASATATDYLRLFALVSLGWMWARMSLAAEGLPERSLRSGKLAVADFFALRLLTASTGLAENISAGAAPVMKLPAELF